ncbi:MAG: PmoA family protein [Candidatus Marinimicrobia bacterium]|nr:PmoA family protein [Candidatus Neomarinimicrobiota bacterium]
MKTSPPPVAPDTGAALKWWNLGSTLACQEGGLIRWQHHHRRDGTLPAFHPLSLADGVEMTWMAPPDHPWHRGLWFAWKYINGLNFWNEDRATGVFDGRVQIQSHQATPADDHSANLALTLRYMDGRDVALMTEDRRLFMSPLDAREDYFINWTSSFTAATPVELEREIPPHLPNGTRYGGYAGLAYRPTPQATDWVLTDSEGRRDLAIHGQRARWLDISFRNRLTNRTSGITLLDHPGNPGSPTPWYVLLETEKNVIKGGAALLYEQGLRLNAGDGLVLRYRILVHHGAADVDRIEPHWRALAAL